MQILNWILGKTSAVGRLIIFSALGGVLVAAMVVPVVAATGIAVRNTAYKFSTIAVDSDNRRFEKFAVRVEYRAADGTGLVGRRCDLHPDSAGVPNHMVVGHDVTVRTQHDT